MADRQRLFVDMDGTLAVFTPVDELETLYEKGYFANLEPHDNVIAAVKDIMANHPEIEVHILSAYLTDSQYALQEKNEWLDRYLPEIDQAHRVFVPCGSDKKQGIEGGIRQDDFLLDDYTHNLNDWHPPARGIKLLNAINHTRGSWEHDRIRFDREPSALAEGIVSIMQGRERIFDERINEPMENKEREFIENLARFDYMRGENNIFPVYEPLSVATNPTAREVYEAEREAVEHFSHSDYAPARLVVLTSESVGDRYAPHDIAYNRPLSEAELASYKEHPAEFLEEMYARLGNRDPQPSDYYGHSASVGDAFVVMTPDGTNCHYVDGFGFEQEADINRVMTAEQQKAAVMGLTVREELDMLDILNEYARASGNEEFEDIVTTETMGRRDFLHDEYTYVFNLAAVREVEEREQDKLAVIYAAEDVPFPEREPLVMGEYDGRYQIAPDAVRAAMPDSRLANGRYVYEDTRVIAGERLQAEIDRRFERATQELSRNASSFYRFEASPTPLGGRGQYDAFVQKYDRSADGVGAIPRDIVYIGEARRAAEIAQFLNAGQASEYSSHLLANIELRRERGDLPMQGSDADRDSIAKYEESILRGIEPMPNRYYEPELDLNGTADELFVQARNGYIESPEALAKVQEILSNPDEQKTEQAFYVGVLREIAENEGNDYQVYAQMKKDILDDVQPEEVALRDGLTLEVRKEQDNVLIALTESGADREATGASAVPVEQFLAMSAHDISVFVGEVYAYNMVEAEREEELDRPFEKITIDGHECNVVDRWQDGQNEYVLAQDLVGDDVYYSLENGVSADYLYNYQPSRENVMEDWAMVAADRNMEKVTIDGHECNVVDRWLDGQTEYVLGNDVADDSFYYAIVNGDISNVFEYDEQPSRERVEDDFLNLESQRNIDRHEAEFGADGERVFPHLNDVRYSENEAIVRLAERIDNIAYQIDPYEYRDTVGVTLEERSESRVELANSIESRDADALQGVVETLTDYRDGLVNDPASANEVRELNDLIYSLEHLDQYEQYYNRETPANAEFAIQEFRGDRVGGRMIEGDQIPMVMSQTPNFSDRSIVSRAVMSFEDRNNLPDNERVFHDGMADDKEFVYGGYDKYVGMSHQNDLSLQPYMERINDLTVDREYQYASPLLMVAEVYYAQQNGLTPEQIDYALDYVKEDRFPSDTFRNVRHGLQDGLSVEQLDVLKGESEMNQEYLLEYMHGGGSIEDARALKGMTEVGQYYTVGHALKDGDIDRDMAKCLIQSVNGMRDENRKDYEAQRANGVEVRPRFYSMDFEFFSEYLTDAVSNDKSITAENVEAICKEFMAQNEVSNMKAFIEQNGGFSAFPHREEAIQVKSEEIVMPKEEEKVIKEGISIPDEKKDPKEKLTEQLQQGIKDVLNSDNFKSWLDTSSKMFLNNYSFNNAMLVWMQRPDATHTMGYEQWKDYGRNVAQGAQGIKIFVPVIAYEKKDGDLWRMIKSNLAAQLKADPSLEQASYKVGMSKLEVTMNRNDLFGLRVNGNEQGIRSEKDMANFIKHNVIGKVPMYFTVGTVFDAKDTIIPEHLWVKKGYKKEELVKDDNGNPIKNRKGEYKIVNTPERQARFNPHLDMSVPEQDPAKMAILYDALKAVSERNGIHVYEKDRDSDDTLKGGADGYYSREFSSENPKGYIVMPTDLEPTRAVSVMIHEMAHSELHGNLKDLADRMGEDNIPSHMREVQAESVAYIVGKNFGIESDTSSFQYLAAYTKGFELQALSKSIEVIYNECKQLTTELKSELAVRGLNMDLTERENSAMDKEAVQTIGKSYATYAVEQDNRISDIEKELPTLVEQNAGKDNVLSVIVQQGMNIDRQKEDVAVIKEALAKLDSADTLNGQQEAIAQIEAAKARIEGAKTEFSTLNVQLHEQMQNEQGLKDQFLNDPLGTLEAMKQDYPQLAQLTGAQMQYLAKSEYVNRDLAPMLRNDPQQFVDAACERASQIDKVASKNGMFVEVAFCEQWTDKPIVSGGALMHPKVADTIIKQAETQIRGLKAQAEAVDDYFPYSKCALTVFQANNGNIDTAFKTRVDIGDGGQSSLTDHLKQISDANGIVQDFEKATREKGAKDKILFNENSAHGEEAVKDAPLSDRAMSKEEWAQEISNAKNADKSDGSNDRADNSKSVKRNSTNERSE